MAPRWQTGLDGSGVEAQGALFGRGRYRILRLLDAGGPRQLYLARDQRLERDVVLTRFTAEVGAQEWLRRAARTATRLGEHAGFVVLFDVSAEDDLPYLVCEYVDGQPLHQYAPATTTELWQLGRQLCDALMHAQQREVSGIDLSASAIWLTHDGRTKLGDFGAGLALPARRDARGDVQALVGLLRELWARLPADARQAGAEGLEAIASDVDSAQAMDAQLERLAAKQAYQLPPVAATVLATEIDEAGANFFGRQRELRVLGEALRKARAGQGRLILIGGDPGIGKTRITEEFARETRAAGMRVLVGRCHEGEGAPAYWPWVQILRGLARGSDPRSLQAQMGAGAADLVQMAPELRALVPGLPAEAVALPDSEHARFRLFDSFSNFLREAARDTPLVLLLDDLHWADRPSLALLAALARDLGGLRLLLIGTHRIAEVGPEHPLSLTLAALRREPAVERLALRGLAEPDMRRLLDVLAGSPLPTAVAAGLARESEGNPFFAGELFRHMIERGALQFRSAWVQEQNPHDVGLPEGVREVIGRRLRNLLPDCLRALECGAVIGRAFDAGLLARVIAAEPGELDRLLDEAASARVLERPVHAGEGWRFVHALIRETLYQHLPDADRAAWHRRIAAELERVEVGPLPVVELACHYRLSMAPDTALRALHYSRLAGEDAAARFAYEEAVAHYTHALDAGARAAVDDAQRVDLRLRLADALRCAGDSQRARETYIAVADEARAAGLGPEQARAALGLGSVTFGASWWANLAADPALLRLLRDARRAVGPEHAELRSRIASRMALELYCSDAWEYCTDVADEAVMFGARLERSVAAATAAAVKCIAAVRPQHGPTHEARVQECLALAEASGSRKAVLDAYVTHFFDLSTCVERADLDALIDGYLRLAGEMREAQHLWYGRMLQGLQRMLDGDMAQAERAAAAALKIGQRAEDRNTAMIYGAQMGIVRFLQGRGAELESAFRGFAARYPAIPGWRAALALTLAEADRFDEARAELDRLGAMGFGRLRTDTLWFNAMAMLGVASLACGHVGAADRLQELMKPYEDRYSTCAPGLGARGPIAFSLACCALARRDHVAAAHYAELAVRVARRMRDRPFELYAQCLQGALLALRGTRTDAARGRELLLASEKDCEALGVAPLSQRGWFRTRLRELAVREGVEASVEQVLAAEGAAAGIGPRRRHAGFRRLARMLGERVELWRAAIGARVIVWLGAHVRRMSDEALEKLFARPLLQWLMFTMMAASFRPSLAFGFEGEVTYELSYRSAALRGREPDSWTLQVSGRQARARHGVGVAPAAHVRMTAATLLRISFGEVTAVAAMVSGLTDVRGDLTLASRLVEMFGGLAPSAASAPDLLSQQTADARSLRALLADFDIGVPGAVTLEEKSAASSLLAQRPDAGSAIAPDGTVALLFTDMEGFTRMTERLGDARAHELMQDHHRIVRSALAEQDGYEVEVLGDGFQIGFATVRRALLCAIAIQRAIDDYNRLRPTQPIRVRMGVHVGEAIQERNKFFGKTVIVASRVCMAATGGEILVTRAVRALSEHEPEFVYGPEQERELKGLEHRFEVAALDWRREAAAVV